MKMLVTLPDGKGREVATVLVTDYILEQCRFRRWAVLAVESIAGGFEVTVEDDAGASHQISAVSAGVRA